MTSRTIALIVLFASSPAAADELRGVIDPVSLPTFEERAKARPEAPDGFVEMSVSAVLAIDDGPVVILRDKADKQVIPIMIGASEALAIQLRLDRRRFERPLTHDLFDSVMAGLGGELVKVQVEDLKDSIYVATLYVKVGDRVLTFDSRPSDSIALAVGSRAPIFVAKKVIEKVGQEAAETAPPEEPAHRLPPGVQTL